MGVEAALITAAIAAAAGTGYSAYAGEQARKDAKDRTRDQERKAREQEGVRKANIGKIREAYGIGDSTTAQTNARTLADAINNYYKTQLSTNLKEADDQFASTSRTSRQNLARVGQLGSGLDTASRSGTLADFLKARQTGIVAAAGAKDRLVNNLTNQRLGYENAVSGGTMANPDFGAISTQRDATLSQAQSQVAPAAIGNLFTTAGNTYFNGRVQEAQGNQGLEAYGFSNSNKRGSIT